MSGTGSALTEQETDAIDEAVDQAVEKMTEQIKADALDDVADDVDDEADAGIGTSQIPFGIVFWGFLRRFFFPIFRLIRILFVFFVLLLTYFLTGLFRGSLWLISLRWILLISFIGWFGTSAFVANYTVLTDVVRPILQVIDDIVLRLFAPFLNDFIEQVWTKSCDFYNFLVGWLWCVLRVIVEAIEIIITSQTSIDQAFIDGNIWGLDWADITPTNNRMVFLNTDPDQYIKTIQMLHQRQVSYEDMIDGNATHIDFTKRAFGPLGFMGSTQGTSGSVTITRDGQTYSVSMPSERTPMDFLPSDSFSKEASSLFRAKIYPEPRYEAEFLTESLLGFQFGWDPDADFPRVNLTQLGVPEAVDLYVIVVVEIDRFTDAMVAAIEWFFTIIKQYTLEFALNAILDLICGDDEDCEISKRARNGDIHLRDELSDIVDDLNNGLFSGFADLFEYIFLDDGVLAGWFVDAYEFFYTEVIRRGFQAIINILFQIPCLNFDSIGCFLASLLDCILIIDLEVCLECHDACDPGCDLTETCPTTCLPYVKSCCPDDDIAVLACVETECRTNLSGLISIFECFGRILLNIVGMLICPLMDIVSIMFSVVVEVLEIIKDAMIAINSLFEKLDSLFVKVENLCRKIVRPHIDVNVAGFDFDFGLDFDVPGNDDDETFCNAFQIIIDLNDVIVYPLVTAVDVVQDALEDFEDILEDFCDEFGNLGENLCLSIGLPASFCENLKDEPSPDDSILLKALRKRILAREERRRGFTRANYRANTYDEMEYMAKFVDDAADPDEFHFSTDGDKETWDRRHDEYVESTEHPVAQWYYRLTSEKYRTENPDKQQIKNMILNEIRRDKIEHLFYIAQNPWWSAHSSAKHADETSKKHNNVIRKLFDKTFVVDPTSTRRAIGRVRNRYKWDDTAEYAEAYRYMQGNTTAVIMQALAVFGKITWNQDEANFEYPEKHEIHGHFKRMGLSTYMEGLGASMGNFMFKYTEPNLLDLDRIARTEAQRHASQTPFGDFSPEEEEEEEEEEEVEEEMFNPYKGAPSVKNIPLRMSQEEKQQFRDIAEQYRWHRDTPSVHIGAHLKTMMMVGFTSLMAPHLVDPVVNSLASRGPAFDAPLTKYLRHFGLTRHMHNITNRIRQQKVRKLHEDEFSANELRYLVDPTHVKARVVDSPYPFDKIYNGKDYEADFDQGKRMLAGEEVDLDRVVISRNPDGTPKRVRSNALALEMTQEKIAQIHKALPFTKDFVHPAFVPMSRRETLARSVLVQERNPVVTALITVATTVGKVILKNPQIVLAVVYPFVISPFGQATAGLWGRFGLRQFEPLFTDYLDFSPSAIEEVALDAAETLLYNIMYALNFATYLVLPQFLLFMLFLFTAVPLMAINFALTVIMLPIGLVSWVIYGAAMGLYVFFSNFIILFGVIPPPPNVDADGIPTQSPVIGYIHDLVFCNPDENTCTTSDGCLGGAFCECPEDTLFEFRNFMFTIENTAPCEVPFSGKCKCWPTLACNLEFPSVSIANIITPECEKLYGYDFEGQVWYAGDGTFLDDTWTLVSASITNVWVQFKFVVRAFLVGWLGFIDRGTAAFLGIAVSMVILVVIRRPIWFFVFLISAVGLWYFPDAPGELYLLYVLPVFEDIANSDFFLLEWLWIDELFKWIITVLRFPNHSFNDPLGLPDILNGEVTCFVIGLFSGAPGALTLLLLFVATLMIFATGAFWLIITVLIQFLWTIVLVLWAFVWFYMAGAANEARFKRMRKFITKTGTNPRFRRLADRLRDAGETSSLAATSRASMNYWIPLPPPNKAELHKTIKKERAKTQSDLQTMNVALLAMQQTITAMQSGPRHTAHPTSDRTKEDYDEGPTPTVIPLYPLATSTPVSSTAREFREHSRRRVSPRSRDVETGSGMGTLRASTARATSGVTRAARGFRAFWDTVRPDADTETMKLE